MHSLRSFSRDDRDAVVAMAGTAFPGGFRVLSYPPERNHRMHLRQSTERDPLFLHPAFAGFCHRIKKAAEGLDSLQLL